MKDTQKLSLCMIVRNEAANLARCLAGVRDLVDEIVIVDTGSIDNTLDIAKEFGAQIFTSEWQENFSTARNYSLAQATGDWILYLDGDEELIDVNRETVVNLLNQPVEGYYFTIINPTTNQPGGQSIRHVNLRLFRNNPKYRFSGAIHEQIIPSILAAKPQAKLINSKLKIYHHGYKTHSIEEKNKNLRNLNIIKKQVEKEPNNNFYLYNLGVALYQTNDLTGAIDAWEKHSQI
ncbi:hypothetical protein N752_21790 [Desulforamulus aquiferis]|nr:glycosyltransferase family 2 protein [Desulforamulus aquiferis]RYD03046.1 hypothetical protein N752_21790 [Desulforamulus aquiferis]